MLTQNATHNDTIFSGRKAVTGLSILQNTPKSSKSNAPKGRGNAPLNKKSQQLQHELLQAKQEIERLRRGVKANSQKNGKKQQPKQRKKKQAHQGKNQQAMQEKTQQAKGGKTRRRGKSAKTGSRAASKQLFNTKMADAIEHLTHFVAPPLLTNTLRAQRTADKQAGAGVVTAVPDIKLPPRSCPLRGVGVQVTKARQRYARSFQVMVRRLGLHEL